ncbi:MAG: hypothetical protein DRI61_15935 [Chloroflexi bacterium]|nr:MAG: hypothetical protein DRI61_15935 [Chloroflexota bacterium]
MCGYETNFSGERRLKETKTFKLVEIEKKMSENTKFKWVREEPICELIYLAGNIYPSYIQCSLFETNAIGERRFIETKKFKLVEVE